MELQLAGFSNEQARSYILMMFEGYLKMKKEKRLYTNNGVAEIIVMTYYSFVKKPTFDKLMYNFKRRYIYNENKVENVHSKEEQVGLGLAYDYISKKVDLSSVSIYDLSWIHEELYSKTPYPEFGGRYRNDERYLLGRDEEGNILSGNVELTPPWNITHEMRLLDNDVKEIVKMGIDISNRKSGDDKNIIHYIKKCIKLNCDIIKIHPFGDGNGRSIRAFTNLLFGIANIPPVYIENKEKNKYLQAMNKALVEGNYDDIYNFYMYKICDSIIALDLNINEEIMQFSDSSKTSLTKKGNK